MLKARVQKRLEPQRVLNATNDSYDTKMLKALMDQVRAPRCCILPGDAPGVPVSAACGGVDR